VDGQRDETSAGIPSVASARTFRLYDRESIRPRKEMAQDHQGDFCRGSCAAPASLALLVDSQLPALKQILSLHGNSGTKYHTDEFAKDGEDHDERPNHTTFLAHGGLKHQ
jgi:hypothetical protein